MRNRAIFFAAAVLAAAPAARAGIRPRHLRCEHLTDPAGIDTRVPRLSWVLESDERAQGQTAYRILVATSPEKLAGDDGDLWDSGKVASSESILVVYGGAPLRSRIRAHWKVRVWDKAGRESPWSEPARFGMGLLDPMDWRARWIGAAGSAPMLRKAFAVAGSIRRATLYATALGLYEMHLNGRRVGTNVLAPEWTDYKRRVQYQVYDVTPLLREGENAIGAILADGWYAGRIGISHVMPGKPVRGFYGTKLRLLAQLEIDFADGTRQTVVSDGSWRATAAGPIRRSCILDGEEQDLRKAMPGWDATGFDDRAWKSVEVADPIEASLVAQPNEPIRIIEEVKPVAVTSPVPGAFVFDLGQNLVGWCRLRARGSEGTEVTLRHAEVLNPDGTIYTDNLRMKAQGDPFGARQTDRFILRGEGTEILEPHFTYHGFRYVEVTGLASKPAIGDLAACVVHSDVPRAGTFSCSDPQIEKLVDVIAWTQRGNLHSMSSDCPQRDERLGWMGDAQIFSQTACFLFDMAAFYTKWIRDMRDDQADDGRFPDFAPHPFDPNARFSGAPAWADAGVIVPWRAYVNYGDRRILEEHFDAARRWVEYVRGQSPDLIWSKGRGNDYGDWLNA
ncbi:MAG: family 78 glycoside hydrolase catalytic domain, partial [Planctomycetes bacterium]|nr:family 78 glycoside hydrolase catalytic domain [Planctomycetota bacterium]